MGHANLFAGEAPWDGPARVTLEARSCEKSGSGLDEGGDNELGVELCECKDTVLLSEGGKGLVALVRWTEGGGARPFPLPRILPPPSFRPDMVAVDWGATGTRWSIPIPC